MDKKEQILHYHRIDGLSQREIARRVGVSRKTVKRYIAEYETLAQADPEEGINMCLASEPKYPPRKIERSRLTEPVCAEIEYWLSENAKRRMTGMRKQCLKKQDIHRALIEKGFNISYSSVCKYIQQRKAEKSKKLLCLQTESYHRALSKHSERFRSADGDEPLRYASRTLVILRTMKGLRLARAGR